MDLNTIIFLAVTIVLFLYVLWRIIRFLTHSKAIHKNQIESYDAYLSAKNNFTKSEQVLFSHIESIFGQEVAEHVKSGTIWENMPVYLLKIALGEPHKKAQINESNIWYYGPYKDEKQEEYFLQVVIENNAVKSWGKENQDAIIFEKNLLTN